VYWQAVYSSILEKKTSRNPLDAILPLTGNLPLRRIPPVSFKIGIEIGIENE
jgi:hypothetical protein